MSGPEIPEERRNSVPRCPLCGMPLDMRIELDADRPLEAAATATLTALSVKHLSQPHKMRLPIDL